MPDKQSACIQAITFSVIFLSQASCSQTDSVATLLTNINAIISSSNVGNDAHYQLTFDNDYPCKATLKENWQESNARWQHVYRFDVTDIEQNTFLQSKAGRSTIVYSGFKQPSGGNKIIFSEKHINNVRYRTQLTTDNQVDILTSMNKAIELCEEKYSF